MSKADTNQASEDELGEILNRLEIESDMSADDFGSYWIEGKPEAKQALLDWHNKQVEAVLDRLAEQSRLQDYSYGTTDSGRVRRMVEAIEAERNKLKEVK